MPEVIAFSVKKGQIVLWCGKIKKLSQLYRLVQVEGQFVRQPIPCPQMVSDYTSNMGGADKCDQYTQYYVFNHKTLKWPK